MKISLPNVSEKLDQKDVHRCFEKYFFLISKDWFLITERWLFNSYENFKNHDKYLILLYLLKKTFDYYSSNFIKLSWNEFFNMKEIEVGKVNISEISKNLNISRETARRKLYELENENIIIKRKKGLVIVTDNYRQNENKNFIIMYSAFISKFSINLFKNNLITKIYTAKLIENTILKNYSFAWKLFFDMQIPNLILWKRVFNDLESFHIWGISFLNANYEILKNINNNENQLLDRKSFIESHTDLNTKKIGINAMSISNLSGVPRATTIRKLNKMVKNKLLYLDKNKLYHPDINFFSSSMANYNKEIILRSSVMITKLLNLVNSTN